MRAKITLLSVSFLSLLLVSCGFQLRGSKGPIFLNQGIALQVNDGGVDKRSSRLLKNKISAQLMALGAEVNTQNLTPQDQNISVNNTQVQVNNINLRKHRLVGRLTEIQLLLTADVTIKRANKKTLNRRLLTQRSYQYNQSSVNTTDAEEKQIINTMYEEMAQKVSRQIELFESQNP